MTDDCVLASALWRRLFSKQCGDPERLECVIHFIRRQVGIGCENNGGNYSVGH